MHLKGFTKTSHGELTETNRRHYVRNKTLLVMKLAAAILLIGCLQVTAKGFSQEKITLSKKDASLKEVLVEISRQSGYNYFFVDQWEEQAKKVTIEVKKATLEEVLEICFRDQPFTYGIVNRTIVIKQKKIEVNIIQLPIIIARVSGTISRNDKGDPLVGATIRVKNSSRGTSTDDNGIFELRNVAADAIITISYSGYQPKEIQLGGRNSLSLVLLVTNSILDQVQVIAYGTTTQRLNIGNITTVKAEEISKQPVNNPLLALEGRVPGLYISQDRGFSGGSVQVRIQGQNSIASGNEPLNIVDGVPFTSQLFATGLNSFVLGTSGSVNTGSTAGNPLNYINSSDIESIDVLKDADATAIYGSRAANGAILITTKKGKPGETKFIFNVQGGEGKVSHKLHLLDTKQYLQMRNEAINNDGLSPNPYSDFDLLSWDTTRNTDWQDSLIGVNDKYNDAEITLSGGNSNLQYLVGGGYHYETTVYPGNFADKKGSLHFNINNVSSNQKLHFQLTGNTLLDNNELPADDDLTFQAITLPPDAPPLYNPNGTINWAQNSNGVSARGQILSRIPIHDTRIAQLI